MQQTSFDQSLVAARPGIERLSVEQFHRMIELGILRDGEPIELIEAISVRAVTVDVVIGLRANPSAIQPRQPRFISSRLAYCVQQPVDGDNDSTKRLSVTGRRIKDEAVHV